MNLPFLCHMALVTIQRSPSALGYPTSSDLQQSGTSLVQLETPDDDGDADDNEDEEEEEELDAEQTASARALAKQRSISETCYFALKGTALVLPQNDSVNNKYRKSSAYSGDIQQHLQSMFFLLRQEDTLKMAVKLESIHSGRTRYLVVVSCNTATDGGATLSAGSDSRRTCATEENCLLGVDYNERATIGLVLPVFADTQITLDGDGGFSVSCTGSNHIFKPVSVQAMWSALQTLHKASSKARDCNYYMGGLTHAWIDNYERKIGSDRSCLNEWAAMDDLESRRPPSPDCLRSRPGERAITEKDIRLKLKEIMMTVDLDEVTSKFIRTRLEEVLDINLQEYKSFIDEEMITILGQMDAATQIFDFLYLGSEWNASNLEELQKNGVGYILNVTREIDNFFPGMFHYKNIRVYDDEGTELLKHWDTTYKFINNARENNSKVLVHCKMGVSRSASVVIAYAMKAHSWNMAKALSFVKSKRTCVKPNLGFMKQLEVYQGILDASKHRHNQLWRSKSENNLKMQPDEGSGGGGGGGNAGGNGEECGATTGQMEETKDNKELLYLDMPTPLTHGSLHAGMRCEPTPFPCCHRPKSWSPDDNIADMLFPQQGVPEPGCGDVTDPANVESGQQAPDALTSGKSRNHVLLTCRDDKQYSVSPNKALHLDMTPAQAHFQLGSEDDESPVLEVFTDCGPTLEDAPGSETTTAPHKGATVKRVASIKDRINELETQAQLAAETRATPARERLDLPENTGLVLNLAFQFEGVGSKSTPASPVDLDVADDSDTPPSHPPPPIPTSSDILRDNEPVVSQSKPAAVRHKAVLVRPETWVEGGVTPTTTTAPSTTNNKTGEEVMVRLLVNQQLTGVVASSDSKESTGVESVLAETGSPSTSGGLVVLDPFSLQLDRIFDKQEAAEKSGSLSTVAAAVVDSPAAGCKRNDSWGSADSAISLQLADPHRDWPASRHSSRSSTSESGQGGLSREGSWGAGESRRPRLTISGGSSNDEVGGARFVFNDEHLLKRTGSFDCALRQTQRTNSAGHSTTSGIGSAATNSSRFQVASVGVQRSQSLRTSNVNSMPTNETKSAAELLAGRSALTSFNILRRPIQPNPVYGPTPYRSPTESREFQPFSANKVAVVATSSSLPTTSSSIIAAASITSPERQSTACQHDPQAQQPPSQHYGSTPILYRTVDPSAAAVLHSSSQPNITCVTRPPRSPVTRSAHAASAGTSPPAADVIPGIVKQNKEFLESFIRETARENIDSCSRVQASSSPPPPPPMPPPLQLPAPTPPTRHSSLFEVCRQIHRGKLSRSQSCRKAADHESHPSPSVRLITEKMEAHKRATTAVRSEPAGCDVTGAVGASQAGNVVIIVDKFGNEVLSSVRVTDAATAASSALTERSRLEVAARPSSPLSPEEEERTVRVLVDRFKVREEQRGPRPRCYSENEAVNVQRAADGPANRLLDALSPGALRRRTTNVNGGVENSSKRMSLLCCHVGNNSGSNGGGSGSGGGSSVDSVLVSSSADNVKSRPPLGVKAVASDSSGSGGGGRVLLVQHSLLPRKVRKSQGKSHPLTRLPPCKPTHSTI